MKYLDEILARCEAATPGPWLKGMEWDNVGYEQRERDEDFMINARTDLPLVVQALKKAVEGILEIMRHGTGPDGNSVEAIMAYELTTEIEKMLGGGE